MENEMVKKNKSLIVKYGWKSILSWSFFDPIGLEDPVIWSPNRWTIDNPAIRRGIKKWREKNRDSVGNPTENPPHNHSTISFPINGIAEANLVITVAPQNDIWPQGRTYPKKAAPISIKNMVDPEAQVIGFL